MRWHRDSRRLIGAGGYGQSITVGVQLNDPVRILEGAIPAAVLALAVDGFFAVLGGKPVPKGLRLERVANSIGQSSVSAVLRRRAPGSRQTLFASADR